MIIIVVYIKRIFLKINQLEIKKNNNFNITGRERMP